MRLYEIAELLKTNIANLPERDRTFALSLADKAIKANLGGWQVSEKQKHWLVEMARKATGRTAPAQAPQAEPAFGSLQPIIEFLHRAHEHLQRPVLRFQAGGKILKLSIAGQRSREPGSIHVTAATSDVDASTGERTRDWYGVIGLNGVYQGSRKFEQDQPAIRTALQAIAANPAGAAKLFGQKTSSCCFCGQELTDGASIAVGYGPICAEHWGLPHGDDHGVKGGFREQQEVAQQVAPKPEAPIIPCKGPVYYEAPKKPAVSQEPLNDPIDDLWVDGFTQ